MKNKILVYLGTVSAFMFAFAVNAYAAVPTASSTLDTIMETVIGTTVALVRVVFTTYWPYVLVIAIISGLVALFTRFAKIGTGKGK